MSDEEFAQKKAQAEKLRDELLATAAPAHPPQATSPGIAAVQSANMPLRPLTLRACFDSYMQRKKNVAQSTKESYTESFELFATLLGGDQRMVHDIANSEFSLFCDALGNIPTHARKRGFVFPTAQALIDNPPEVYDKEGVLAECISGSTANNHIVNLQGFSSRKMYGFSDGERHLN